MTYRDIIINVIFWGVVIVLYKNRDKTSQNRKIWNAVQLFLAVLLATLGANYVKTRLKDWWAK